MKIGILTFHRAENFGAVLQCLALQNYLISKGNEVEVIDYRNPSIEHQYDIFNPWCIFQTKSLYGGFCVYVKRFFNFRSRLRKKYYIGNFEINIFRLRSHITQIVNFFHMMPSLSEVIKCGI